MWCCYLTTIWCCQTNEPKHQYSFDAHVYEVTKERHSVRAASRFSLNGCCQTNEPEYQYSFDEYFYEVTKERHSVRAASRFSLNVLRFESDLCELNRL